MKTHFALPCVSPVIVLPRLVFIIQGSRSPRDRGVAVESVLGREGTIYCTNTSEKNLEKAAEENNYRNDF